MQIFKKKLDAMISRCRNPLDDSYHSYGGRGIVVCRIWRSSPARFTRWARAAGWKAGLVLDRIDNLGPYAPWNCRWITPQENNDRANKYNRRQALGTYRTLTRHRKYKLTREDVLFIHDNPTMSSSELALLLGVNRRTVWNVRSGATWGEYHPALTGALLERDLTCKCRVPYKTYFPPKPKKPPVDQRKLKPEDVAFICEHTDWSYDALAKHLGVSTSTVLAVFTGDRYCDMYPNGVRPKKQRAKCHREVSSAGRTRPTKAGTVNDQRRKRRKLTFDDAMRIRFSQKSARALAKEYGVTATVIMQILKFKTYVS